MGVRATSAKQGRRPACHHYLLLSNSAVRSSRQTRVRGSFPGLIWSEAGAAALDCQPRPATSITQSGASVKAALCLQ
jgi:hypothetical protein